MLNTQQPENFLRLSDVMRRTGLSRSTIYLNIKNGQFPKNINIGTRSVGWLESEINAWMHERIFTRQN